MKRFIKTKITNPIQLLALIGQVVTVNGPFLPVEAVPYAVSILAGVQTITAILQAYKNPNGTPAQVPWQPGVDVNASTNQVWGEKK